MNFIEKKLTEFEKKFKHTILSDTVMYKQIESFLTTAIQEAQAEERKRYIEIVEHEEKHAPKCPKDITVAEQGGWYLGRIDGLQQLSKKLSQQKDV